MPSFLSRTIRSTSCHKDDDRRHTVKNMVSEDTFQRVYLPDVKKELSFKSFSKSMERHRRVQGLCIITFCFPSNISDLERVRMFGIILDLRER